MTRDPLQSKEVKKLHFQVYCQGKAGQGQRIESTAWYTQTLLLCFQIKKTITNEKNIGGKSFSGWSFLVSHIFLKKCTCGEC